MDKKFQKTEIENVKIKEQESLWDLSDLLQVLLNPSTKAEAFRNFIAVLLIAIPLSIATYLIVIIDGVGGFLRIGKKTKCDRCGKKFINNYTQIWKTSNFCPSCFNEQVKVEQEFINNFKKMEEGI